MKIATLESQINMAEPGLASSEIKPVDRDCSCYWLCPPPPVYPGSGSFNLGIAGVDPKQNFW